MSQPMFDPMFDPMSRSEAFASLEPRRAYAGNLTMFFEDV
jgi:hypothetical protein